uniref:Uncharacterized protein n=1 Tax=Anguilla anguilla TaxID=7936 RepID=A0A0E9UT16_ANGAN
MEKRLLHWPLDYITSYTCYRDHPQLYEQEHIRYI